MNRNIRDIECFLLDIDGTVCLENNLIDGAKDFLEILISQKKKCIFINNDLSKSKLIYVEKLKQLGIDFNVENILTSGEGLSEELPYIIDKPNKEIIDDISKKFNIDKGSMAIVGDKLYEDIMLGINSNITSILVLSGKATMYDLEISDIHPTFVFSSIKDIYTNIKDTLVENI